MNTISQQHGFTLIELLVTVAVLAILSSFAVPAFNSMLTQQNLNTSTRELAIMLSDARAHATLERREVKVELNSSAIDTNTQLNWVPSGKSVLKSNSATSITFLPTGVIKSNTAVAFEICAGTNKGPSKIITVRRMGTLQVITEGTC